MILVLTVFALKGTPIISRFSPCGQLRIFISCSGYWFLNESFLPWIWLINNISFILLLLEKINVLLSRKGHFVFVYVKFNFLH